MRARHVASVIVTTFAILAILFMLIANVLSILNAYYGMQVYPFTLVYEWIQRRGIDPSTNLVPVNAITFIVLSSIAIGRRIVKARARRREKLAEKSKLKRIDTLMRDLEDDVEKPEETRVRNGALRESDVDIIVSRWHVRKERLRVFRRALAGTLLILSLYWVLTNVSTIIDIAIQLIGAIILIVALHRLYPVIMAEIYFLITCLLIVVYLGPYRIMRKKVFVIDGAIEKHIGRLVFVRGTDERGRYMPGFTYAIWYGLCAIAYAIRRMRGREKRAWKYARPSPHEIPIGDPFYLYGNPQREPSIERFSREVVYQSNAKGWLERRRHPTALYTSGEIEMDLTQVKIVGEGAFIYEYSRDSVESTTHHELSTKTLTYRDRNPVLYHDHVDVRLHGAGRNVGHAVRGDPALAKQAVERFVLPSSDKVLGEALKDFEQEIAESERKRKEKKA